MRDADGRRWLARPKTGLRVRNRPAGCKVVVRSFVRGRGAKKKEESAFARRASAQAQAGVMIKAGLNRTTQAWCGAVDRVPGRASA